ncbi:hypothetical protein KKF91_10100 [Myxococcota bacterium]|nr:hypothetical protein [Myxococcota bacterium]MBU1430885.1 hypothetical protein [Myxococcota bacterium]MBU1900173.1 hypothetical protein [Myxococcota bacterium]
MRVAITGIGLVAPGGVGLEANLAALRQPLQPQPAAEDQARPWILPVPPHFKARDFLKRRKDLKLMARPSQLAVAAAKLAVASAGLAEASWAEAGLFMGVGREPSDLEDIVPCLSRSVGDDGRLDLDRLMAEGVDHMNPIASLKTLPNMAVAHVAIQLGLMGPTQALTSGPSAGARALLEAATAIVDGRAPLALAGAADDHTSFGERVSARRMGRAETTQGEAGVFFVLEPLSAATARGAHIWGLVSPYQGPPRIPDLFGDCGAAGALVNAAARLGAGEAAYFEPVGLEPIIRPAAPALLKTPRGAVAITGVGLLTPLGRRFEDFTRRLLDGEVAAAPIRAFNAARFPSRNACEVRERDLLAHLPPPLALALGGLQDRRAEMALIAALDAVADHGALDPRAGIVYATGLTSVTETELAQDCLPYLQGDRFDHAAFAAAPTPRHPLAPKRHQVDRPARLLKRHLGLSGPEAVHFSACAAGGAALAHAADLIRRGAAPQVLVGASDSMILPFGLIPFILLGATSTQPDPALAGRPFEGDRDGFIMGEGGAFFVLEPLEAARAAKRHIYGLILGSGQSCDAHAVTAPHPEGLGAERAMRRALSDAGIAPNRVDYINAHGTATPLNDVTEAAAIARVFGVGVPVSSSKSQLGHSIAAAGCVELAACLAAFAGGRLPPNARLSQPDPQINVHLVPPEGLPRAPRVALSNSFGFGGQNTSLIIAAPEYL